jgi:hypothetical protein
MRFTRARAGYTEDEQVAASVIFALRVELLRATVGYGVYAALSEDDAALIAEWLTMLNWARDLIARFAVEFGLEDDGAQERLDELILALEHPEQSDAGDLFDNRDVRDWARDRFESLAEKARPIELMAGEPLGEVQDVPAEAGLRLFAAVQDSLVLASIDDADVRRQRAGAREILDDLIAARDQAVWEQMFGASVKRKSSQATVDVEHVKTRGRLVKVVLAKAGGHAAAVYTKLAPDGRELTTAEASTAREELVSVTVGLRSIHPDRDLIRAIAAVGPRQHRDTDFRPTISLLRMMQRGFALALSDNPDRRTQAMPRDELGRFAVPVHRFWQEL